MLDAAEEIRASSACIFVCVSFPTRSHSHASLAKRRRSIFNAATSGLRRESFFQAPVERVCVRMDIFLMQKMYLIDLEYLFVGNTRIFSLVYCEVY